MVPAVTNITGSVVAGVGLSSGIMGKASSSALGVMGKDSVLNAAQGSVVKDDIVQGVVSSPIQGSVSAVYSGVTSDSDVMLVANPVQEEDTTFVKASRTASRKVLELSSPVVKITSNPFDALRENVEEAEHVLPSIEAKQVVLYSPSTSSSSDTEKAEGWWQEIT